MDFDHVFTDDDLTVYSSNIYGDLRAAIINGLPWFVGKDMCDMLGNKHAASVLSRNVSKKNKLTLRRVQRENGRTTTIVFVNIAGLNEILMKSNTPRAHAIKQWVANDVLPAIDLTGMYVSPDKLDEISNSPADAKAVITNYQQTVEQLREDLTEAQLYKSLLDTSDGSCSVGTLAKMLKQRGYNIGQKRLFDWLRSNGYLSTQPKSYNVPLQWAIDQGLFEVNLKKLINYTTKNPKRMVHVPMITPKGQAKIISDFIKSYTYTKQVMKNNPASDYDTEGLLHLRPIKGGRFDLFQKKYWKTHAD